MLLDNSMLVTVFNVGEILVDFFIRISIALVTKIRWAPQLWFHSESERKSANQMSSNLRIRIAQDFPWDIIYR